MFEIELKNPNEMVIKAKDRVVNINVAQCTVEAGLAVGPLVGAGELEIGEIIINAIYLFFFIAITSTNLLSNISLKI